MKISNLKEKITTCILLIAVVVLFVVFDIPCFFNKITDLPCPGCGMTRAYFSLLHMDFAGAFKYHFMFWSVPILILFYFKDGKLFRNKYLNYFVLILFAVGFLANWVSNLIILIN